ncbi:unnamed protein product [Leptosia nina]|uniref:Uncharacterized protein n=1 Tax=Leptosia nina TaxID=320188 RepID=A0AAV1JWS1_9NEOP
MFGNFGDAIALTQPPLETRHARRGHLTRLIQNSSQLTDSLTPSGSRRSAVVRRAATFVADCSLQRYGDSQQYNTSLRLNKTSHLNKFVTHEVHRSCE